MVRVDFERLLQGLLERGAVLGRNESRFGVRDEGRGALAAGESDGPIQVFSRPLRRAAGGRWTASIPDDEEIVNDPRVERLLESEGAPGQPFDAIYVTRPTSAD